MNDRAVPLEDAVSFKELKEQPLYASRIKIHPKDIQGTFRRVKWAVLVVLLGIYYVVPWIRWDRGPSAPDQAVLIDMPARRAYFFGIEIWPQEIYFLTLLLILAAFGLFFVTSLFGRVWCGYTCPQTCGPTSSCGSSGGSRATVVRGSASTRPRGRRRR